MYKLLHIPTCRDIMTRMGDFESADAARTFLNTHVIYFLKEQDAYVAYESSVLESIKVAVTEFITNTSGYHVQDCEIEILEVKE